jgi:hypothetical protein
MVPAIPDGVSVSQTAEERNTAFIGRLQSLEAGRLQIRLSLFDRTGPAVTVLIGYSQSLNITSPVSPLTSAIVPVLMAAANCAM